MKILVTGGAGFIGSHLVDRLIEAGHRVVIVDNLSTGRRANLNKDAIFYESDICDPEIKGIFEKERPEIVFHLAAQISVRKSVEDPFFDAKVNILGSLNVIENFIKLYNTIPNGFAGKKFVFVSTGGVMYGDAEIMPTSEKNPARPICPYGVCKNAVENYLNYYGKVLGLAYSVLRLGNVYGPRQNADGEAGVVAIFSRKMLAGKEPVINGDGLQTRDYVYVGDVVAALVKSMHDRAVGIYNIGTAREINVNYIFDKVKELTGSKCAKIHGPFKSGDHKRGCLDASRAKKDLDWEPETKFEEGLELTVAWFKKSNQDGNYL